MSSARVVLAWHHLILFGRARRKPLLVYGKVLVDIILVHLPVVAVVHHHMGTTQVYDVGASIGALKDSAHVLHVFAGPQPDLNT